jgi:uncharacterized protein
MVQQIRRAITIGAALLFLLIGFIGGFVPILQGWIFVLIGLTLLAKEVPMVRHKLEALKRRYPNQAERLDQLKAKWSRRFSSGTTRDG